jgi:hypothetical protein
MTVNHTAEQICIYFVMLQFLEDCLKWFDEWEAFAKSANGDSKKFLSPSTAAGLRVTLRSTIQLSQFLLQSRFVYVLTSRFSQDPLEVISFYASFAYVIE